MGILELVIALKLIAAAAAVTFVVLTIHAVIDWFTERSRLKEEQAGVIAFTLREALASKRVPAVEGVFSKSRASAERVIQGFFDTESGQVLARRDIEATSLDPELARLHHDEPVVVYT